MGAPPLRASRPARRRARWRPLADGRTGPLPGPRPAVARRRRGGGVRWTRDAARGAVVAPRGRAGAAAGGTRARRRGELFYHPRAGAVQGREARLGGPEGDRAGGLADRPLRRGALGGEA